MPGHGRARELLILVAVFGVALSVYVTFLTVDYSFDSVGGGILFYQWLANGKVEQLFHRYHILYLAAAAGVEMILARIGVELDPLTLLQLLSAAFAAGSIAVYQRLARVLGLGAPLAATMTVLLGGGFCFWYYATTGESYPISICFLLLAFLSAARMTPEASRLKGWIPGVWLGLAIGFHGTCLLALPGLVVMAWPEERGPGRYRQVTAAIAGAALVVAVPYMVRYVLRPEGVIGTDVSSFAAEEGWSFPPHLIAEWLSLASAMVPLEWPGFPSRFPGLAKVSQVGLLVATVLPLALPFGLDRTRRKPALAVGLWFAVSFVFFSMYFPGSPKFAAYLWTPLLLLVGFAIEHVARQRTGRVAAVAALAVIVAATLIGSFDLIRRQTEIESNRHLVRARAVGRVTQPDDVIVHVGRGDDQYQNVYTPYFAARRSLSLEQRVGASSAERATRAIEASLASAIATPGRVIVVADALVPGAPALEFERAHELSEGSLARIFAAHDPQLLARDPALGSVWLLTR